jgi:hypothetical protein
MACKIFESIGEPGCRIRRYHQRLQPAHEVVAPGATFGRVGRKRPSLVPAAVPRGGDIRFGLARALATVASHWMTATLTVSPDLAATSVPSEPSRCRYHSVTRTIALGNGGL